MSWQEILNDSLALLPELILGIAICVVITVDMLFSSEKARKICFGVAIAAVALAIIAAFTQLNQPVRFFFKGLVVADHLGWLLKSLFLLGAGISVIFVAKSKEVENYRIAEFVALALGATIGACLLVSSGNFLLFVLALETLSICSYVLASYNKHNRPSAEAGLKFTIYGAVATAIMLFGISYFYGLTGTIEIRACMLALVADIQLGQNILVILLSFLFVLAGIGYKIAMVPYHFWCPDVYQGSPTAATAFFSVVSKAAGFGGLLRLLCPVYGSSTCRMVVATPSIELYLPILLGILAVVTMTYGNLAALKQTDVKRILGYSSIAHAGYLLMALATVQSQAIEAVVLYLVIYLFMNLAAFWVVILLVNQRGSSEISAFKGIAYQAPFIFGVLFLALIALTGLPPTAGFVGKLYLFKVVIGAGLAEMVDGVLTPGAWLYLFLAFAGVINSAISLYYYMKIARVMVFEKPEQGQVFSVNIFDVVLATFLALPLIILLNFEPLLNLINGIS